MQIRTEVEVAHAAVRRAQSLGYQTDPGTRKGMAPLRVRLALTRTQVILSKLLTHQLPVRPS